MIEILTAFLLQTGDTPETRRIDPYLLCVCPDVSALEKVEFSGFASDAEVILGDDGRSAKPRQATIFRVDKGPKDFPSPAKVWHLTKPEKCGVSFSYGRRYDIVAVKKGDEIETNWCLMGKPR